MNSDQKNRLDMLSATNALLSANTETSDDVGLTAMFAAFVTKLGLITTLSAAQTVPIKGKVKERNLVFADATGATLAVAGRVHAYAAANHLPDLAARVPLKPRDVTRLRLGSRVPIMQRVHDEAQSMLPQLTPLGVTAAVLTELQTKIGEADIAHSVPRTTVAARKVATAQLAEAFADMEAFLVGQLDPVMIGVGRKNPTLYANYQAARIVIDRPGTPAKTDDPTGGGTPVPTDGATQPPTTHALPQAA